MPGRKRTAKSLGLRHDLNYFKRWNPYRRWKLIATGALIVIALAWLGAQSARGRSNAFSAGPLSSAHAFFGNQCATCHVSVATNGMKQASFREHVPDRACLSCHEAPAHHPMEAAFTPSCGSCHREHTGVLELAKTATVSCTQCHGDLRSRAGELNAARYVTHITGFNSNHPEFAPLRQPGLDPGTVAFNHYAHLSVPLMTATGKRVQLECADCHRPAPDAHGWEYGETSLLQTAEARSSNRDSGGASAPDAESAMSSSGHDAGGELKPAAFVFQTTAMASAGQEASSRGDSSGATTSYRATFAEAGSAAGEEGESARQHANRALMAPISFANNCAGCHTLQFDPRFAESVPHKSPEIVHAFVLAKFKAYLAAHPSAWREPSVAAPARELPGYARMAQAAPAAAIAPARSPDEWLNRQVSAAEKLLWGKTCRQCHQLSYASGATLSSSATSPSSSGGAASFASLPKVAPANITLRWLPHSVFSHDAHRAFTCVSCHAAAPTSHDTADVLIPSIKTCQSCHNGVPNSYGHAENRCFECHEYHEWRASKPFKGSYSLHELMSRLEKPSF